MEYTIIKTPQGVLRGLTDGRVCRFLGIPYAKPPVGKLRWRGPEKLPPSEEMLDCTKEAPMPMQILPDSHPLKKHPMSEDCLYLNLWAPVHLSEKAPVHVWFYGGALQAGCADSPDLDGTRYAEDGVISVNVSYRVGTLGFMCHPMMKEENPEGLTGNFGHRDQIAALIWIQENIEAFGGDPGRITISGQSAGSGSCCTLMNAPMARGLFHRAICHSGDIFQPERDVPLDEAEAWGLELQESFGCHSLDEFREIPAEALYRDGDPMITRLHHFAACVIDPAFLPDTQGELTLRNECAQLPVIIGTNLDEGSRFRAEEYVPAITNRLQLPNDLYAALGSIDAQANALATDYWYARHLAWAKIRTSEYNLPTWQYVFARRLDERGAFHGAEIPYTFGTLQRMEELGSTLPYTEDDAALSDLMHRYWVQFIKNGNPNGDGLPLWPDKHAGGHMEFNLTSGMNTDILTETGKIVCPATEQWMRSRM